MTHIATWSPGMPSIGSAVLAVGVFDGVHVGHQALIRHAVERATSAGVRSAVLTFDRDPEQVVDPSGAPPQLLDLDSKLRFISELGVEDILVVPFDDALAALTPEAFLADVLLPIFRPTAVLVGYDFRFGTRASGDVSTLERFGATHGFTVIAEELVTAQGAPVRSTRIRGLIAAGDVATAARLLGRPHRMSGKVVHGRGEGRAVLGIPTANLVYDRYAALPEPGVYAGVVVVDGATHAAAIATGRPPMFPDAHEFLEAHLIDFDGDLYGRTLTVEFLERLRPQRRFESLDALAAQMRADIERTRRLATGIPHDR